MWYIVVLVFVVMFTLAGQAFATNPADPTSDFRFSGDFVKLTWDNVGSDSDCVWLFASKEIGDRTSVMLFNSHELDGSSKLYELGVIKQFDAGEGTFEAGVFTDIYHEGDNDTGLMLDWSNSQFGIGAVLRIDGCDRVAARTNITKNITFNLSVPESGETPVRWGIGYSAGKVRLEFAAESGATWFRASEPVGRFYPEFRSKFSGGDTFIGFGIGFAP